MKSELVPEIHDIGKLLDKEFTGIEHNFENYPGKLEGLPKIKENATWIGIKEHHCQLPRERKEKVLEEYPKSKETVIFCIADNLASTVSRHIEIEEQPFYNVYKLWNPTSNITGLTEAMGAHSKGEEWIEGIVNFVNRNPTSAEEYFKEFGDYLKKRCEDASPGANITSLYTHSLLTGKFYRILRASNIQIDINLEEAEKEEVCKFVNEKLPNQVKLTLIKSKINLPQYLYKTRDLNAIKLKGKIFKSFQKYPDVFFRTSDEIIIFSKDESILDKLREELEKYGLILFATKRESRLGGKEFKHNFLQLLAGKGNEKICYPKSTEEISEIPSEIGICEICQLNPVKPYESLSNQDKILISDEKSGIIDKLCDNCIEVRRYGEPLILLSKWEEGNVMWIKITLDFGKLVETLRVFYREYITGLSEGYLKEKSVDERVKYLKKMGKQSIDKNDCENLKKCLELLRDKLEDYTEVRPSVISEFQWDYNEFLKQFNEKIHETFDNEEKMVQDVLEDLFCIKIDKLSEGIKILELYSNLINDFFPKFKETEESPIKLTISCSHVKFPFFEHWRYLENPEDDVNVMLIGRGEMNIKLKQLDDLLDLKLANKTAIEKLTMMAETSEELAFMQIFSKEGIKNHPELQEALKKGFNLSDLLTYVKIKSD